MLVTFAFSELLDAYYYRTANVGQTVKFPCHTKLDEDVDWVRVDPPELLEKYIYLGKLGHRDLGHDPRFMAMDKNHSHTLVIYNVTVNDSAYYRCVDDSGLGHRRFYGLTVEGTFTGRTSRSATLPVNFRFFGMFTNQIE